MITVVSWNIARRLQAVEELLVMDADVALLQEVGPGALERLVTAGGNVAVIPPGSLGTLAPGALWLLAHGAVIPPGSLGTLAPGALWLLAHGGEAVRPGGGAVVQAGPAQHPHRGRR